MAKSKDIITQIKKAIRRKFSADEKIRIVLEGLRGEQSISEICRREGIAASIYYKWSAIRIQYKFGRSTFFCHSDALSKNNITGEHWARN